MGFLNRDFGDSEAPRRPGERGALSPPMRRRWSATGTSCARLHRMPSSRLTPRPSPSSHKRNERRCCATQDDVGEVGDDMGDFGD